MCAALQIPLSPLVVKDKSAVLVQSHRDTIFSLPQTVGVVGDEPPLSVWCSWHSLLWWTDSAELAYTHWGQLPRWKLIPQFNPCCRRSSGHGIFSWPGENTAASGSTWCCGLSHSCCCAWCWSPWQEQVFMWLHDFSVRMENMIWDVHIYSSLMEIIIIYCCFQCIPVQYWQWTSPALQWPECVGISPCCCSLQAHTLGLSRQHIQGWVGNEVTWERNEKGVDSVCTMTPTDFLYRRLVFSEYIQEIWPNMLMNPSVKGLWSHI